MLGPPRRNLRNAKKNKMHLGAGNKSKSEGRYLELEIFSNRDFYISKPPQILHWDLTVFIHIGRAVGRAKPIRGGVDGGVRDVSVVSSARS